MQLFVLMFIKITNNYLVQLELRTIIKFKKKKSITFKNIKIDR